MSARYVRSNVHFKKCTIRLEFDKLDIPFYTKVDISIERPGREKIELSVEDFTALLNALMSCQSTVQTGELVDLQHTKISLDHKKNFEDPEMYLITTKINDEIRILFLGYDTYRLDPPRKKFCITFEKDDDIFYLCGEFLRIMNLNSQFKVSLQQSIKFEK
jgi:hypothetical protein